MNRRTSLNDIEVIAKFARWKLLLAGAFIIALAAFCWMQLPDLTSDYQGRRFSPEMAKVVSIAATAISTAFIPIVAWNTWNSLARPGAIYAAEGHLFIYWLFLRRLPIDAIVDVTCEGRSGPFGDTVRLRLCSHRDVTFQTDQMKASGGEVVAAIKRVAADRARA